MAETNKLYYKKLGELPKSYRHDFWNYLTMHADEYFGDPSNRATDERDFETFVNSPCDRKHLVKFGEIMLVDLEWPGCDEGSYVLCKVTKRKHKLCTGRIVHLEPIMSIMPIKNIPYSIRKNGYWLLPVLA